MGTVKRFLINLWDELDYREVPRFFLIGLSCLAAMLIYSRIESMGVHTILSNGIILPYLIPVLGSWAVTLSWVLAFFGSMGALKETIAWTISQSSEVKKESNLDLRKEYL